MNQMFVKSEAPVEKQANKLLLQVNNQMIIVEDSEALADILGINFANWKLLKLKHLKFKFIFFHFSAQQEVPSLKNFTFKLEASSKIVKSETPPPPSTISSLTPIQTPTSTALTSPIPKKHQMVTQVWTLTPTLTGGLYEDHKP